VATKATISRFDKQEGRATHNFEDSVETLENNHDVEQPMHQAISVGPVSAREIDRHADEILSGENFANHG
jgi:hypothetical protein